MSSTPVIGSESESPEHTSTPPGSQDTEHLFHLAKSGQPWLTLGLHGAIQGPENVLVYFQGQHIAGSVKLDLRKDTVIRSVSVFISGDMISRMGVQRFILMNKQLFDSVSGPAPQNLTWPFSLTLPNGVKIALDTTMQSFDLPPSFKLMNQGSMFEIQYQLGVQITTGKFKSGHKLHAPFKYVPLSRSNLPPLQSVDSLQLGTPDLQDPGRKTLASSPVKGTLADKQAHLQYVISLPEPLRYTRGSTVPISLSITSTDANVLATEPAPSSLVVRLDRRISFKSLAEIMMNVTAVNFYNNAGLTPEEMCRATWSEPTREQATDGQSKLTFQGQLQLPKDIPTNCEIINFQLEHTITVYPSKFSGFSPAQPLSEAIISQRVNVVAATDAASAYSV